MDKVFAAILLLGALRGGGGHDALAAGCIPGFADGTKAERHGQAHRGQRIHCQSDQLLTKKTNPTRKRSLANKANTKGSGAQVATVADRS